MRFFDIHQFLFSGLSAARSALNKMDRYIYFYAETRLQDKMYWGGDNFHWYEGKRFGFFEADFGNDPEDFTQSFSCE